jgi:rhodanese-related sulfurtransferase
MLLIDVRSPDEFSMGHVPGAVNIPYQELADRLGDVRPRHEKGVVLYCESGRRAGIAEGILRKAGLDNIRHLEGDMSAWRQSKLPIEKDAH